MSTNKPVVWFKYNIEQIAWTNDRGDWNPAFLERFGFAFKGNSLGPYTTVHYREETFFKFQDASDSDGEAVSEIGVTEALAFPASVKATISSGAIETGVPYVICGGNLWYVADLPFSFISEEDRYLVFADLLFDMLGADCKPDKRALVRLDDVHVLSNPDELRAAAKYLSDQGVPLLCLRHPVLSGSEWSLRRR